MSASTEEAGTPPFKEKPLRWSLDMAIWGSMAAWVAASICVSAGTSWEYPVVLLQLGGWLFLIGMIANATLSSQNGRQYSFGEYVGSAFVELLFQGGVVWLFNLFGLALVENPTSTQIAILASLSLPPAFLLLTFMVSIFMEERPDHRQPRLYDWEKAAAFD